MPCPMHKSSDLTHRTVRSNTIRNMHSGMKMCVASDVASESHTVVERKMENHNYGLQSERIFKGLGVF